MGVIVEGLVVILLALPVWVVAGLVVFAWRDAKRRQRRAGL